MLVAGPCLSGMIAVRSTATGSTLHDEDPAGFTPGTPFTMDILRPQAASVWRRVEAAGGTSRFLRPRAIPWKIASEPSAPLWDLIGSLNDVFHPNTTQTTSVHAGMTWNDRNPLYLCEIHVRKDSGFPLSVRAFSISGLRVLLTNSSIVVRSAGRSAMSFTRPSLRAAAVFLS